MRSGVLLVFDDEELFALVLIMREIDGLPVVEIGALGADVMSDVFVVLVSTH